MKNWRGWNFFRNLGINKKIFLAQLCVILVIIPSFIAFYYSYKNVEKEFLYITDSSLVRIQSLLSMKTTAIIISGDVAEFVRIDKTTPGFNEKIDDEKNKILAQIELLKDLEKDFSKSKVSRIADKQIDSKMENTLLELESNIILDTVTISTLKESGQHPEKIVPLIATLTKNVAGYQNAVDVLTSRELNILLEKKVNLQHSRFYMIFFLIASLITAVLMALLITFGLSRFIAKPLVKLQEKAARIAGGELITIESQTTDEIGNLEKSLNVMVGNILSANEKLVSSARLIGMSDVANNVLHNVGNVLNSINVSVDLVKEKIETIKIDGVKKVAGLITENMDNAAVFFASSQGKLIPQYMNELGLNLENERGAVLKEIGNVDAHIKHIKSIITLEQEITARCGMVESVCLFELIDNSLRIAVSENMKNNINIIKNYEFKEKMSIDKVRLEQIFVNLLKNAVESLSESTNAEKELSIRVFATAEKACVKICDNGMGVLPENIQKIFSGGFTSKKNGHGFGLHFSALAIQEIKGTLTVTSEGLNKGACFTIEIPLVTEG